ncbi:hypothetical protein Tco_0005381 [Tanacetum coccineum]
MTRSAVKKLTKPLDEPEREFRRLRRAALRQHQNEYLAIAGRNLFNDDASSSNDNKTNPVTPLKSLQEHSLLNSCALSLPIERQKKDDDKERFISIFKQIHVNLPFLEAMIHMPKGAKVLKDLLSHKEKFKKAAFSFKLSEEYSAVIQRSLPQKEGDPGINHDEEWMEAEEGRDSDKVLAVSFYPKAEPVKPLEWKASENRLKPSSVEPPKLELKELAEHLEYAFLQEDNQLPVVISSTLSATKKASLFEVPRNHKGAIGYWKS